MIVKFSHCTVYVQLQGCNAVDDLLGNLALSRALGDFVYKRDNNRAQDEQIVIGNVCIT